MYFIELFGNLVYDESISNISLSHFFKAFMSNFLTATGNFKTKSLARLEYNFLSNSEIVKGSNFNSSFVFRHTSVQGNFFSGRPSCFSVCQRLLGFAMFSFTFSSMCVFFLTKISNRVTRLFLDFFHPHEILLIKMFLYILSRVCILSAISPLNHSLPLFLILKRRYGVNYTVVPGNKITICNVRIIKAFTISKLNSLQHLFIHISRRIFQREETYFLVSVVFPSWDFPSTIY